MNFLFIKLFYTVDSITYILKYVGSSSIYKPFYISFLTLPWSWTRFARRCNKDFIKIKAKKKIFNYFN